MKINSTLILTFLLLVMMVGTGSVSAWWGYQMGSESLEGVKEPDSNPTKKLTRKQGGDNEAKLVFVKEKDLIIKNYDFIQGKKNNSSAKKNENKSSETKPDKETKTDENKENDSFISSPSSTPLLKAPVKSTDQDITLEVSEVRQQDGAIVLNVSLKNDGRKSVKFLYSFLDVRDDQGSLLSAVTDGLPGELPANGEAYSGTIRIPTALLIEAKNISLSLTDYPEQKLQLKISDLPVTPPAETPDPQATEATPDNQTPEVSDP
jgi:hypothetical protein